MVRLGKPDAGKAHMEPPWAHLPILPWFVSLHELFSFSFLLQSFPFLSLPSLSFWANHLFELRILDRCSSKKAHLVKTKIGGPKLCGVLGKKKPPLILDFRPFKCAQNLTWSDEYANNASQNKPLQRKRCCHWKSIYGEIFLTPLQNAGNSKFWASYCTYHLKPR